jgi:hypothetical protein
MDTIDEATESTLLVRSLLIVDGLTCVVSEES